MPTHLTSFLYHVSFQIYRPLKLPVSCEVGPKSWFLGPRFVGGGITQIADMRFQITLILLTMWPIFVEFGSASSEIRRRKKKEEKSKKERIPGKTQVRRHIMSGGLTTARKHGN